MTDISHIVTLSPEGQIVIPKDIRDALGLREGTKLEVALGSSACRWARVTCTGHL